ncbi:MAG: glycosyl hydrolase 53 family protein [Rhodobacteraceae bacterium]|nr:glycosyl hydrolase 53 family protein [Paracoccaceae bacterium]
MFRLLTALFLALASLAPAQTIGIAITESNANNYDADVNQALRAGATITSLTLFWDEAMQGNTYAPELDWPSIANSYYPSKNMGLVLSLAVIDTVADRRPEALRALPFDDPRVISAFIAYATEVLSRLEDTNLVTISIGNEVDGVLTTAQSWDEFSNFFKAAKAAVQAIRPGAPIGFTTQWHAFQGPHRTSALEANTTADAIFINYYPLDSGFHVLPPEGIATQLDGMIAMAAGKPVFLTETGYPSGGCGASEALQTQYFQELFSALETRKAEIPLTMLVWLHDRPAEELAFYNEYYGVSNPCFSSYLGTLGLRSHTGQNKPAFTWLIQQYQTH